jgi:hypothetical protein
MYLKALTIDPSDVVCSRQPSAMAEARSVLAADDALLDLAAELLVRRGGLTDLEATDLAARVRKVQALNRWRDRPL